MWEKVTFAWSVLLVGRRENELAEANTRCQGALGWKVGALWVHRDSEHILKPGFGEITRVFCFFLQGAL